MSNNPAKAILRNPRPGDMSMVMYYHAILYGKEYGWDETFEIDCAQIVLQFAREGNPNRQKWWIAELDGQIVGSVVIMEEDIHTARLRMLLVRPEARGQGLGRRLIEECIQFSRECGYPKLMLTTLDVLQSARHLYGDLGFTLTESREECLWGKDMTLEYWHLNL